MKTNVIIGILCFLTAGAQGQMPIDPQTGRITYTEVVKADSARQKDIYMALKLWAASTFNSNNNDVLLNDDVNFNLVLKPVFSIWWDLGVMNAGFVRCMLVMECKDGRYRYSCTNFIYEKPANLPDLCDGNNLEDAKYDCTNLLATNPVIASHKKDFWENIKKQTDAQVLALIQNMKQSVSNTLSLRKDNW